MPRRLFRSCAALGFNTYEVVEMNNLDLMAADFKRAGAGPSVGGGRPAGGRTTARRAILPAGTQAPLIAPRDGGARRLLEKVIAAKGGLERLRGIKNITATTKAIGLGPNAQQGTVETVTYLEYPNHVRVESKTARGDTVQVYDGSHAWVKDPAGIARCSRANGARSRSQSAPRHGGARSWRRPTAELTARQLLDARDENGGLRYAMELSGTGSRPDDPLRRSRNQPDREAELRRRRTRARRSSRRSSPITARSTASR